MEKFKGFIIKSDYSFDRYPFILDSVILESLLEEIAHYKLPVEVYEVLRMAWNSRFWENKGFDGATAVKDKREPRLDAFLHDYMYRCGYYGYKSDVIYRELMILTGYKKFKSYRRFGVIRITAPYFLLRHSLKDNIQKIPYEIDELYYTLIKT